MAGLVTLQRARIASLKPLQRGGAVAQVEELGPEGEDLGLGEDGLQTVVFPEAGALRPGAQLAGLRMMPEEHAKFGGQWKALAGFRVLEPADRLVADPATGGRRCAWLPTLADLDAELGEARRGEEVFLHLYRGELAAIIGPPGDGKSTLLRAALAAASRGEPFLGRPTLAGPSALLDYEGPPALTRKRLAEAGADPRRVHLASPPPHDIAERMDELAELEPQPIAVVVDSFHGYGARCGVTDFNSAGEVKRLLLPLLDLARAGPAVVVVHHVGKAAERGAMGSQAFLGDVDELLELRRVPGDPAARELRTRKPRWEAPPTLSYVMEAGELRTVEAGGRGLEARVLDYVRNHPGASKSAVKTGVSGRNDEVWKATEELLERGDLVTRGGRLHLPDPEGAAS
ncbi:MAG TPA: AAA family ATPase [Thermoanaerobaculia bacterium]|nr:AAA family ATPase [Thermoanaerobaculia bacterium]